MKCTVGDSPFDPRELIYRDQGYGSNPGRPLAEYTISVANEELLGVFAKPFDEFVALCKEEDKAVAESDIPVLKQLGYPSLGEMLGAHRTTLASLVKDYLYFQLLDALLGANRRSTWRFAINEITEVSDEGAGYLLKGVGYFI